jgi:hypothetical protein
MMSGLSPDNRWHVLANIENTRSSLLVISPINLEKTVAVDQKKTPAKPRPRCSCQR